MTPPVFFAFRHATAAWPHVPTQSGPFTMEQDEAGAVRPSDPCCRASASCQNRGDICLRPL